VHLEVCDSADPGVPDRAERYLGGPPQIVFIDSSHQYEHTLRELDLWWAALCPGGILALHDVSQQAQDFDSTGKGGVRRAFGEWTQSAGVQSTSIALNEFARAGVALDDLTYGDWCGLGLVQKPR
jgi:cephalosporin hydroxylase